MTLFEWIFNRQGRDEEELRRQAVRSPTRPARLYAPPTLKASLRAQKVEELNQAVQDLAHLEGQVQALAEASRAYGASTVEAAEAMRLLARAGADIQPPKPWPRKTDSTGPG